MMHGFETDYVKDVGVRCSIIYSNLSRCKNKEDFNGKLFVKTSFAELEEIFPYLPIPRIKGNLSNLDVKGYITTEPKIKANGDNISILCLK